MSSVSTRPNGHRWLFYKHAGKRHTIRLGAIADKDLVAFQQMLDRLVDCRRLGVDLSVDVLAWLSKIDDRYHKNLATAGLVDPRGPSTLAGLIAEHIAHLQRKKRKPSTIDNYDVLYENLKTHFGETCRINTIRSVDADVFESWLTNDGRMKGTAALERSTVTNRCRRARTLFKLAKERGWITENPFRSLGQGSECNPERDAYISVALFDRILHACDDPEFRLLLAICRFMGCRCPSEVTPLRWAALDLQTNVLTVKAPKTEEYQPIRQIPVFAEAGPYFKAARQVNLDGELMFPRHQITGAAITDKLEGLCRKIREPLWPKPFVNLRASAEHDMVAAGYSINEFTAWMGHSPTTALKHYNRVAKELQTRSAATVLRLSPETSKRSKNGRSKDVHRRLA